MTTSVIYKGVMEEFAKHKNFARTQKNKLNCLNIMTKKF